MRSPADILFPRWFRARSVALLWLPLLLIPACINAPPVTGPAAQFAQLQGREVVEVEVLGDLQIPEDTIRAVLGTRESRCRFLGFLPVCIGSWGRQTERFDPAVLAEDLSRIRLVHRAYGYYGTQVSPDVVPVEEDGVRVRFLVAPGDRVVTRTVEVLGTEGIVEPEELERRLPLQEGEPFGAGEFQASADTILTRLLSQGYAYAQLLRGYSLDTIADIADARYEAVPGPEVRVDTILVIGTDRLDRETVRRQLTFRQGSVLRAAELNRSQRQLYDLGMVNFASVQLAPDTLQVDPDSANATVVVRVVEAPRYLGEASAGYGTLDCLRTQGRFVDRNFTGGSRRLEVTGSVSKIGVGSPADFGLEGGWLCSQLSDDPFSRLLNYHLGATFVQPRLFGTRTQTTLGVNVERTSLPDLYLRRSRSAHLSFAREVARQTLVTTTFNLERVGTEAQDIFFCVALQVCDRESIVPLTQSRWSNSITAAVVRDRSRGDLAPVGGYQLRASVDWASGLFFSDDRYLRLFGDLAAYHQLRPGWVLAGHLVGGAFVDRFLEESGFIPPEQLFYGGGPNTVRGVERNTLGPTVYVASDAELQLPFSVLPADLDIRPSAVGGTRMAVASAELRMPSPWLRDRLGLAAFVDAGRVWPRTDSITDAFGRTVELRQPPVRITPGAGVRYQSPVGPIRVDLSYDFSPQTPAPLFAFAPDEYEELYLVRREFVPANRNLLDRFQLYVTVGQPF